MSEIDPEYLNHQYLYVPWVEGIDTLQPGKALGLYLAAHYGVRLTVVCPKKSNAEHHRELAKLPIVTERTGYVADGSVVLAWVPTRKAMKKVDGLKKSIVILVEWPAESYEAWAKLAGAYNVVTGEVMSAGLSEAGLKALEGVAGEGYKGWHDSIAERMTISHLKDLAESDGYDRAIVLEFATQRRSLYGLQRLEKILDRFERSLAPAA